VVYHSKQRKNDARSTPASNVATNPFTEAIYIYCKSEKRKEERTKNDASILTSEKTCLRLNYKEIKPVA